MISKNISENIHAQAILAAQNYKTAEFSLLQALQAVEAKRVFIALGYSSLFRYAADALKLSESVAFSLITVARKARDVPSLQLSLQSGEVTLSNARMISAVITIENSREWIAQASTLSKRQLEKEIVKIRPQAATPERVAYTSEKRVRLEMGLSESEMLRLRRVQDLVSQSQRRPASLEETVQVLCGDFLSRKDPVEQAKRQTARGQKIAPKILTVPVKTLDPGRVGTASARRIPIPAVVRHAVNLRDGNRCGYVSDVGTRCGETRWIELHHRIPVSHGGQNTAENLVTLCSGHHRAVHA